MFDTTPKPFPQRDYLNPPIADWYKFSVLYIKYVIIKKKMYKLLEYWQFST